MPCRQLRYDHEEMTQASAGSIPFTAVHLKEDLELSDV